MKVVQAPSPNHGTRPAGTVIDCIVLHADASPHEAGTVSWLQSPTSKVSYHALVSRDGSTVYAFVDAARRAWHAGVSTFAGRANCNDYSLGYAFANRNDGEPYPLAQLRAMAALCASAMRRFPAITLDRITTHRAVSPGRKTDPCPPFDLVAFRLLVATELEAGAAPTSTGR